MDVILMIDESGSMRDDMPEMKVFAKEIVDHFQYVGMLGEASAKFAVISFAETATTRTSFTASRSTISSAIDSMSANGWTAISQGLRSSGTLFSSAHRTGAVRIVLTLSDGDQTTDCGSPPDCTGAAVAASAALKAQSVTVFAWGFGGVSASTLASIASDSVRLLTSYPAVANAPERSGGTPARDPPAPASTAA